MFASSNVMARDPSVDVLLRVVDQRGDNSEQSELNELLQKELAVISSSLTPWNNSQCMLQDLGNFLHRTTKLLSSLANDVVRGDQVLRYAKGRIDEMERETDFSDLDHLDYLADKHLLLKSFADQLRQTVETFEVKWHESAKPPFQQPQNQPPSLVEYRSPGTEVDCIDGFSRTATASSISSEGPIRSSPVSQSSQQSLNESPFPTFLEHNTAGEITQSPPTIAGSHLFTAESYQQENDIHEQVKELIDSLGQRGTGRHTCPYGANCTKGGVRNGNFVVFERNSAFRAHLLKHERLYRCTLPYCTAKGGFARIDQLRRHQLHVPHHKH